MLYWIAVFLSMTAVDGGEGWCGRMRPCSVILDRRGAREAEGRMECWQQRNARILECKWCSECGIMYAAPCCPEITGRTLFPLLPEGMMNGEGQSWRKTGDVAGAWGRLMKKVPTRQQFHGASSGIEACTEKFRRFVTLRVLRGGRRQRIRIGKRWIDPRKIVRPPKEEAEPDPRDSLNITVVPIWTEEAQTMLRSGDDGPFDVDDQGRPVVETYIYQSPRRIINYTEFLRQETPRIANARLWHAAEIGEDDEIRLVAAYLDADVNASNPLAFCFTAMHFAALNGHTSTVALLASMGADVNARDVFGSCPLHYAADVGHIRVVEVLLQLGARAYAENMFGRSALEWALDPLRWPGYHNNTEIQQPQSRSQTFTPIHLANVNHLQSSAATGGDNKAIKMEEEDGDGEEEVEEDDAEKRERDRRGDDIMSAGRWECVKVLQKHMGLDLVTSYDGQDGGRKRGDENDEIGLEWGGFSATVHGVHVDLAPPDVQRLLNEEKPRSLRRERDNTRQEEKGSLKRVRA
jgi:hypothetical protein